MKKSLLVCLILSLSHVCYADMVLCYNKNLTESYTLKPIYKQGKLLEQPKDGYQAINYPQAILLDKFGNKLATFDEVSVVEASDNTKSVTFKEKVSFTDSVRFLAGMKKVAQKFKLTIDASNRISAGLSYQTGSVSNAAKVKIADLTCGQF